MSREILPVDQLTKIGTKAKFLSSLFRDKLLYADEKRIYADNEVEEEIHHDE